MGELGVPLGTFGDRIVQLESAGATAVVLVVDDLPQAVFGLADTLRDQAKSPSRPSGERASNGP